MNSASMPANNLHLMPELLAELEQFCNFTQSQATQQFDRYDVTKAANETIALWMQREMVTVLLSCQRSPEEHANLAAEARRGQMELVAR